MKECSGYACTVPERSFLRDLDFIMRHDTMQLTSLVALKRYGWPVLEWDYRDRGPAPVALLVYIRGGTPVHEDFGYYAPLADACNRLRIPGALVSWFNTAGTWTFHARPLGRHGSSYFKRDTLTELEFNAVLHRVRGMELAPAYKEFLRTSVRGHDGDTVLTKPNFPHLPISYRHRLWCRHLAMVDLDYLLTSSTGTRPFVLVEYTTNSNRFAKVEAAPGEKVLAQFADALEVPAFFVWHDKPLIPKDRTFYVQTLNDRADPHLSWMGREIHGEQAWFHALHALAARIIEGSQAVQSRG